MTTTATPTSSHAVHDAAVQRRIMVVLVAAQVLGALGVGAALTLGTGMIIHVSENSAISGLAPTMNTLGAALAGIPLAKLAMHKGRRWALASGNLLAVLGSIVVIFASANYNLGLLLVGILFIGTASAVQLQARFAATDLAAPKHQSRDLSLVVWSTTLGAVAGPNLATPGELLGHALGMPYLTGAFLITGSAQLLAALVILIFLRPDPLLTAQRMHAEELLAVPQKTGVTHVEIGTGTRSVAQQRAAIAVIAIAQAVMVAIMAMTPGHLIHFGYPIGIVGFTISLHIAGMYALAPVFGLLSDRFGARAVIMLGIVQLIAATVFTGFGGENVPMIVVGLVLLGTGWSAVTVAAAAWLTMSTPLESRTKRQGQSDALMNLAGASAGALAGFAFVAGGFPMLSTIGASLTVVILLITLLYFANRKKTSDRY